MYGAALLLIAAIVIHQMRARTQDVTVVQSHGEIRYRMDVNTATVAELDLLPGVGPRKAAAIMAYRKEHGAFHTLADLANVQGVSLALAESLRELVLIDGKTKGTE
ncbi:MAG: helix-hairpin-helix domain-containing protein [Candidatus Brocadiae bacterium]|nr:helix-hairpin-helix domain-containing protein [Candidatus Brocadiia bacterium]